MQSGDILDQAAQLLATKGNCATKFHDEVTGQYCAWGAINQVTAGQPFTLWVEEEAIAAWEALYDQLPQGYAEKALEDHPELGWLSFEGEWEPKRRVVVNFNNEHPGQPVIDLFEKAAANLGHQ